MKKILLIIFTVYFFAGFGQSPIYIATKSGDLYSFNLATCAKRHIGASGQWLSDIAITPNGRLWAVGSGFICVLHRLDTATAMTTSVGILKTINPTMFLDNVSSMVALNDSTLLVSDNPNSSLYSVKTSNGQATLIGSIGYVTKGDLTWYDNALYVMSDKLVKITLNANNTSITSVTAIGNDTIPTCWGAVTFSTPGSPNFIAGFGPNTAYKICPIDGTYSTLCSITATGADPRIAGADYMRLPVQQPEPTSCIAGPIGLAEFSNRENKTLHLYPNPAGKYGSIRLSINNDAAGPFSVNLLTLQGLTVFQRTETLLKNDYEIDLRNLSLEPGTYMIIISGSNYRARAMLVIE